ncbi:MAG: hypothetical protein A3C71_02765 [Candidatus Yanofskybacteria bacterium RIFCSPHIGHO2_02_FULL_43_15c]|uniref:Uncharacterized protein n=2 Tax=Candidatus Yanofskyibacteriota TaxID=1752733 RepID=A0A1F8EE12_9BACT|nr:MAG: hypothetical protein A2649_00110 [Candidatus Yanofskybacteria bacterium RIFCSPHIGHO2_01_FULL_41_26]OGN12754.1 MAG: hypothetical protein A3C71_02765 [Candidatus Yanofskybacteria bacterium RIFCSPHIGHO2_02_FULL_43_15c]OGN21453.1 MAG: hypothetical protein A2915_02025 [Candidatus Yanofskybacteria bacterium RIFCSPLOWO2_01_FULL_41_34]
MRGRTLGQRLFLFAILLLIAGIGTVSSAILFTLANYSDTRERLVSNIKMSDSVATNQELVRLHYFYDLSKKWKVQFWADKYLFGDSPFYEFANFYLIHDWEALVKSDLKDKLDDPRAYIYGNAKFRQAQTRHQSGDIKGALNALPEIASYFEKALRNCLDSGVVNNKCFDRVWNYDLVTNKKDAEEALKNPQQGPRPKFILGPIKDKNGPPVPVPNDKDKKGGDKEGEEGGQGSLRKRP